LSTSTITMELAPVTRRQSFDGDTKSNSTPADAPPDPAPHSLVGKAVSYVSTPSRLKMREALAASTRHLESNDYDQAHAVCRQAAEHAADYTLTFGTEDSSGDDASSKNDAKPDAASREDHKLSALDSVADEVHQNPVYKQSSTVVSDHADTDADSVQQAARDQTIAVDATPSSNDEDAPGDPGAAERRGETSWCHRHLSE